ncbi:MAG: HAD hydrolase family protein [Clostridia bacterium]|nr:HAD hydrolase family protein [Clostridia bacterium]
MEFHATGMVTFPLLGTKADAADKIALDPTREKRKVLYPEVLQLFPDYTVYIGGSSSFDFTEKAYNKYDSIMAYAKENGYRKEEILYVGDVLAMAAETAYPPWRYGSRGNHRS